MQFSMLLIGRFFKEIIMNWNIIEGNWTDYKGQVKAQWGKLTDDHLEVIAGKREQLAGQLQKSYGITQDEVELQLNSFQKYLRNSNRH
jgi:uncharacterized protein YjbJ (UPF0337 family)